MNALTIAGTAIRNDEAGRFCLNDLHRAAGGEKRHQPSNWLHLQQTQDLAAELAFGAIPGIPGIESKQGLGTYVAKELVYAYAMWISASFHLKVIRAYDGMASGNRIAHLDLDRIEDAKRRGLLTSDQAASATMQALGLVHQPAPIMESPPNTRLPAPRPHIGDVLVSRTALSDLLYAEGFAVGNDGLTRAMVSAGWLYHAKAGRYSLTHAGRAYGVDVKGSPPKFWRDATLLALRRHLRRR